MIMKKTISFFLLFFWFARFLLSLWDWTLMLCADFSIASTSISSYFLRSKSSSIDDNRIGLSDFNCSFHFSRSVLEATCCSSTRCNENESEYFRCIVVTRVKLTSFSLFLPRQKSFTISNCFLHLISFDPQQKSIQNIQPWKSKVWSWCFVLGLLHFFPFIMIAIENEQRTKQKYFICLRCEQRSSEWNEKNKRQK